MILLRPFVPEDAPRIYQLSREPGLARWMPDQVYANEDQARKVLAFLISQYDLPCDPAQRPWVLAVVKGEEVIGHVGLSPHEGGVEIGYAIAEAHQGKGFASEAITLMCRKYSGEIKAIVASENVGSIRVLEKCGFEFLSEGPRTYHGKLTNCRIYKKKGA